MHFNSFDRWKILAVFLSILSFLIFSCKKSQTVRTPAELLPQTWYVNYFSKVYYNNVGQVVSMDTLLVGNGSDYIDFRSPPNAYIHFNTVKDTILYSLLDTKTLLFDQDTMTIDGINENMFQYSKSNRSIQPYYDEIYRFYR